MTVSEALQNVDNLRPNTFSDEQKCKWLSTFDKSVNNLHRKYKDGGYAEDFEDYTPDNIDRTLLIESPFDEIYSHYLFAQIDYYNGEFDSFNNSNAMYEAVFGDYKRWFNRTHTPLNTFHRYF